MKKLLLSSVFAATFAVFVACGDNADSTQDPLADLFSSSGNADSPDVESVETQDDLPSCTSKREGKVRFVEEDEAYFVCVDKTWTEVGDYSATEEDLPNCSAKRDGQVYYVVDLEVSLVCKGKKWVEYAPESSSSAECDEDEEDCEPTCDEGDEECETQSSSSTSESSASAIRGECMLSVTEWGTQVSTLSIMPGGNTFYLRASSLSNWPAGQSSLPMTLSYGDSSQTVTISSTSAYAVAITAPSELGKYEYVLSYEGAEVCSFEVDVEYPQITATCAFSSVSYTQSPVESAGIGSIVYFNPSGFSSDWTADLPYSLTMSIAGKSATGADSTWDVSVNKSFNGGFSVKAPKVSGIYTYKLMYYDNEVCSADLTVVGSSSSSNVIASSSSAKQSSCSEEESSSSEEESSSSEAVAEVMPSGTYDCDVYNCVSTTYLKSGITYGEILDTRDDQVYKVVTIGTQTWMAQNLNYAPDENHVHSLGDHAWSGCYGEGGYDYASQGYLSDSQVAANCSKYGRLYTWGVAMDKAGCGHGEYCDNSGEGTQGICPSGWHLPSHGEFETLINYIDPDFGYGHTGDASSSTAGEYLKATSGWNNAGYGEDTHGFSALPGGDCYAYDESFSNVGMGIYAFFWSSTEYNSNDAYYLDLSYKYDYAGLGWNSEYYARSIRCLKDSF